jgi:hypothetical protein
MVTADWIQGSRIKLRELLKRLEVIAIASGLSTSGDIL